MAYGSELFLGVVGTPALALASTLGLEYHKANGGHECSYLEDIPKHLADKLDQAQLDAFAEMGLKIIDPKHIAKSNGLPADDGYLYVQGLDGKIRQTCHWDIELHHDPHECGHDPDDVLFGVSLVSRYFPVFLDWDKDHGGSGDTISLTPDVLKNIEIARKHLAKVLPFIQDAPIVFREKHY